MHVLKEYLKTCLMTSELQKYSSMAVEVSPYGSKGMHFSLALSLGNSVLFDCSFVHHWL